MPDRLASLRARLLAAMLATAAATIGAGSALTGGLTAAALVAGVLALVLAAEAALAATLVIRTVRRAFDGVAAQLQQADTEQNRFLADLAHEIATPLSAVSGFAFALVDQSAQTTAERAEAAAIVVHESERLRQLLDDVRHLHRLELAESVRQEQVDVEVLCAEAARRFRLAADHAEVTLVACAEPVSVIADPRLVDAVVNNFVSNAIRYTPAGGRIQIRAGQHRSATVIAVRDTGIGIAPQHLERIFDRLYRVDEARDRATGGSGLGLAIARRAAQSLGATIEVDSTPGSGSEFRLLLPSPSAA
ncbi:MAG: sensor histidine kinase [Streptosporangiales bacterium]